MQFGAFDDWRGGLGELGCILVRCGETGFFRTEKGDCLPRNISWRSCKVRYDLWGDLESNLEGSSEGSSEGNLKSTGGDNLTISA